MVDSLTQCAVSAAKYTIALCDSTADRGSQCHSLLSLHPPWMVGLSHESPSFTSVAPFAWEPSIYMRVPLKHQELSPPLYHSSPFTSGAPLHFTVLSAPSHRCPQCPFTTVYSEPSHIRVLRAPPHQSPQRSLTSVTLDPLSHYCPPSPPHISVVKFPLSPVSSDPSTAESLEPSLHQIF